MRNVSTLIDRLIYTLAIIFSTNADHMIASNPNHIDNKQPKLHVFESIIRINLHKSDLELDRCVVSAPFELHYVTWKIQACKRRGYDDDGDLLMVTFESDFNGNTEAWSCEAEAIFKLLPKEKYNAAYARFGNFNFDIVHSLPTEKKLVTWNNLLTKHMIDDIATIDVTIKVKPPNRIAELRHISTKFQMRILELSTLSDLYSEEAIVRGIRWKMLALKRNEHLGVFVIANEDDMDLDYGWNVSTTFRLISLDSDKTITKTFSNVQFDWTNTNWGFIEFIKWTDLMSSSNNFVKGNAALLQIELDVDKPKSKGY